MFNLLQTSKALSIVLTTSPCLGKVVYQQGTVSEPDRVGLGWYSTSEPRPTRNFRHADNFHLDQNHEINAVRWWGLSEGSTHTNLSNFDTFTIQFYTNRTLPNGNIRPQQLLFSETFNLDDTHATATGRAAPTGAMEYLHNVTLSESIELSAEQTYWISISARSINPSADVWQWQDSNDYDTRSSSFDYSQNRWLVLEDTDSAFELISVPAPSSSGLLFLGLIAQRRRRSNR